MKVGRHEHALSVAEGAADADRTRLLHLLACRHCRRKGIGILSQQAADDLEARLIEPARPEATKPSPADLAELADLAYRIASEPPAVRLAAIEEIEADRGLSALECAAALIAAARSAVEQPSRAAPAAELALELLTAQTAISFDEAWPVWLDALSLLVLLRHRLGKLEDAEAAYRQALPLLAAPSSSRHRAILLAALAQLRWTQNRLDEAAACFSHAGPIFTGAGEHPAATACRLLAGFVFLAQRNAERARPELEEGHLTIDPALAPALAARAAFAAAYACAAVGRVADATAGLKTAHLYEPPPDAHEAAQRSWLEALTLAVIGRLEEADAPLDAARRTLLAQGTLADAARCTLDLLRLRVEAGRPEALPDPGAELLAAFDEPTPELVRFAEDLDTLSTLAAKRSPLFAITFRTLDRSVAELPPAAGRREPGPSVQQMADRILVTPGRDLLDALEPDDDAFEDED